MGVTQHAWLVVLMLIAYLHAACAFLEMENLYCGAENCYDVLGVDRDSNRAQIQRAYRKLARKWHPDVSKEPGAEERFRLIATAYETLKEEESRKDYDYMLDNPEEAYYNYYRYYKRRVTPKVDVRIVIAVTVTVISIMQYFHKSRRYEEAIQYAMQNPKFRNQALQIIHQEGLVEKNKKTKNKRSKDEKKKEEERVLREVVEDSIDIRGGYSQPSLFDILWVQLLLLPYYIYKYAVWKASWVYRFTIMGQEYGDTEKEYLTYTGLGMTSNYWEALDEESKADYMERQLWIKENLIEYKAELEEEMRVKLAESGRHKMWRRYMKKGGPGQMTFMED